MHRSRRAPFPADGPYTFAERQSVYPAAGGRSESKESISRISPEIALQNAAANADRNGSISVPAWSPLTVTASVSQKRTVCRCQQTPVPGRHRRCRCSRNAGAPAACRLIFRVQHALSGCFAGNCFLYEKASRKRMPPFRRPCPFAGNGTPAAFSLLLYPIPAMPSSAD